MRTGHTSIELLHLEGMGVIGSVVAHRLAERGIDFTWDDAERDVCAWRACTGGIYPSGIAYEEAAYNEWRKWATQEWCDGVVEAANFWFLSKRPPHGGNYEVLGQVGPLRLGALPSYHLNAQRFVERTRETFAEKRVRGTAEKKIVCHGYGPRLDHYLWGWHAKVRLRIDPAIQQIARPCFYLRTDRFTMFYAYPVAGEPGTWYAGSTTQLQRLASEQAVPPKLVQWADRLNRA